MVIGNVSLFNTILLSLKNRRGNSTESMICPFLKAEGLQRDCKGNLSIANGLEKNIGMNREIYSIKLF